MSKESAVETWHLVSVITKGIGSVLVIRSITGRRSIIRGVTARNMCMILRRNFLKGMGICQ